MGHYPAIREFIQGKATQMKNLEVTYTQGAPPNLLMKDTSGAVVEEVNIANWKSEHIDEYLAEKLASS